MEQIRLRWIDPVTGTPCGLELEPPVRIGRDGTNHVILRDNRVSRQHAVLTQEEGRLLLVDLNSRNGTWLRGQRTTLSPIVPGEAFQVGGVTVQVECTGTTLSLKPPPLFDVTQVSTSAMCEQPRLVAQWGQGQITGLCAVPGKRELFVLTRLGLMRYDLQAQPEAPLQAAAQPVDRFCLDQSGMTGLSLDEEQLYWWRSTPARAESGALGKACMPDNTALAPDGLTLAIDQGEYVEIWSLPDGEQRQQLAIDTASPQASLAFAPDCRILAAMVERGIQLWDIESGRLSGRLPIDTSAANAMSFSPDQAYLAVAYESTVQIWDLWRTTLAAEYTPAREPITHVVWSSDGQALAAAAGVRVLVYRLDQRDLPLDIQLHEPVVALAFLAGGGELACATARSVEICSLASGAVVGRIDHNQQQVAALAFTHRGQTLACAGASVHLRRLPTGENMHELPGGGSPIYALSSATESDVLAVVTANRVEVWRLLAAQRLTVIDLVDESPISATLDADGQALSLLTPTSASRWNAASGASLSRIPLPLERPSSGAITSDLFAILAGEELCIGRVADGAPVQTITGVGRINALALAADSRHVAVAQDDCVRVWGIPDGRLLHTIAQGARHVTFTADCEGIAVVRDNTLELYNVADGAFCLSLGHGASPITAIALTPTGDLLANAFYDGTVQVWSLNPPVVTGPTPYLSSPLPV